MWCRRADNCSCLKEEKKLTFKKLTSTQFTWIPQTQSSHFELALKKKNWIESTHVFFSNHKVAIAFYHEIKGIDGCDKSKEYKTQTWNRYPAILWLAVTLFFCSPSLPGSRTRPLTNQWSTAVCLQQTNVYNTDLYNCITQVDLHKTCMHAQYM